VESSRCIGQQDSLGATIRKRQEDGTKNYAHCDIELKESGLRLMDRVRDNGHLVTVLKGMPLNTRGIKKQKHELIAETPCTLLWSFDSYMQCIKTPASALESLMQGGGLNTEAKEIVRAMLRLRSDYKATKKGRERARETEKGEEREQGK